MSLSATTNDASLSLLMRSTLATKKQTGGVETTPFKEIFQQAKGATSATTGGAKKESLGVFFQQAKFKNVSETQKKGIDALSPEARIKFEREARLSDITMLALGGRWDDSTKEARKNLQLIANDYFKEAKEKYGCTEAYKPYLKGLPEFDPAIEKAMRLEVRDRLNADPRVRSFVAQMDGIYPIPDKFDLDTTFGPNRMARLPPGI